MAPVNIESTLQEQAADRQCCEIGDGRDHLTALIVLEPALAARPDAAHEVARHVAAVNERLSAAAQLVAFTIVAGERTVAGEELTPTLKIRRATIEKNTPRRSEPCTRDHPATAPHTATHDCGRLDLRPSRARSGRGPSVLPALTRAPAFAHRRGGGPAPSPGRQRRGLDQGHATATNRVADASIALGRYIDWCLAESTDQPLRAVRDDRPPRRSPHRRARHRPTSSWRRGAHAWSAAARGRRVPRPSPLRFRHWSPRVPESKGNRRSSAAIHAQGANSVASKSPCYSAAFRVDPSRRAAGSHPGGRGFESP